MKRLFLMLICCCFFTLEGELFFSPEKIEQHLKGYSEEEIKLIQKDLGVVRSVCLDETKNAPELFYLATAGGPGARKTTILEKFVATHPEYAEGVYLDPDPRTLKLMVHTYYSSLTALKIAEGKEYDAVIKNAYEKWRPASNYIVLNLLEEAFALGRSIIYGTTSTGAHIPDYFSTLKEKGYKIVLILCSCPDEVRFDAVNYRNQVVRFYQSSPEDAVSKGVLFPQRMGTYFAHADLIYFYWSDSVFSEERAAGVWRDGELEVLDSEAMEKFIAKYEADRENTSVPPFKSYL